ncbi:MAG: LacI family DNA-binding transcriptional regulator [Candidatus Puniceispirillaceae bacterium]
MEKSSTITDVAKKAGTSAATVSRYLTNATKVSRATAARIEQAITELHYVRNRAAAATRSNRTGIIGMVVPTIENSIFAELIESLNNQLRNHDRTMLIATNGYRKKDEIEAIKTFTEHGVDGVILVGCAHDEEIMNLLKNRQIPTLNVWNHIAGEDHNHGINTIGVDNFEIGYTAAKHLIELGHQKIACIFGNKQGNDRAEARESGIRQALSDHDISVRQSWFCHSSYDLNNARTITDYLLRDDEKPTAIMCGNDIIAFAAIWAAQAKGLHVPNDLSIMGIGDFQGAAEMTPALSTIRIPARLIGKMTADKINAMLTQNDLDRNAITYNEISQIQENQAQKLKVPFELKIRQSTARPS